MNKKRFVISIFCSVTFILMMASGSVALAERSPDPTPDQLHKSSEFAGVMGNMRYLYEDDFISDQNVKSIDSFLAHDLIFNIKNPKSQSNQLVKTEFLSKELAGKYRNQHVDIFGTNYYARCYYSAQEKDNNETKNKTCMYGGLTDYKGNHFDNNESQSVVIQVYEDNRHTLSFDIQTDKKLVTAQELDVKARNFLVKKLKLYDDRSSPYETGYIKFIEYNGDSFWYDMMPPPGNSFDQSKYLMIYADNKTVDSKSVKIEVHLTKK
ncbi:exotoxin [Staphylococcus ursi]|uniref:exotoxin n=1 Tax=Staphylococcus sp. MI 10-1553 TaxID=1912064 RepID=UPI00139810AC|nr:exotoxin [Staphylococcus sp. MI 10-1553]QHW37795.1 exotoxin [Staphylococcus sp. MI 10-1553]